MSINKSEAIIEECLDRCAGTAIVVTGATGLIGKCIVSKILSWNACHSNKIRVYACVRDLEKAHRIFGTEPEELHYIVGDILELSLEGTEADYVIHAASNTASRAFVETPVEVADEIVNGTGALLRQLKGMKTLKKFVFLSTMEIYGTPPTDSEIFENTGNNLNTMNVRACYPIAKRMAENLCACYASEYGVPFNVARLTQTFGKGVQYSDQRVFAEFARCVIEERDIVLSTKGETKRCYIYLEDAVAAIFRIMTAAESGEAYNVANHATYCSIYEMAQMVAGQLAGHRISVVIREKENAFYAPTLHMNLNTEKLQALGWEAGVSLPEMFEILIEDMKQQRQNG